MRPILARLAKGLVFGFLLASGARSCLGISLAGLGGLAPVFAWRASLYFLFQVFFLGGLALFLVGDYLLHSLAARRKRGREHSGLLQKGLSDGGAAAWCNLNSPITFLFLFFNACAWSFYFGLIVLGDPFQRICGMSAGKLIAFYASSEYIHAQKLILGFEYAWAGLWGVYLGLLVVSFFISMRKKRFQGLRFQDQVPEVPGSVPGSDPGC